MGPGARQADRWENVLFKLRNADLARLNQNFPNYPYRDLLRAIQVSVDALDPNLSDRYLDFAVFPENTTVPMSVLEMFWAQEESKIL
jgi:hypothetical protein